MKRILVIDDDEHVRRVIREFLELSGYQVEEAPNGRIGISLFRKHPADLIITDIFMPEKEGLETITELRREFPEVRIIAVSGGSKDVGFDFLPMAKRMGAVRTFRKPFDPDELIRGIAEVLDDKGKE